MEIKEWAPVIVGTLSSHEHFIRQIESLKKNIGADKTDMYIGLDFPTDKALLDGYNKICDYLDNGDFSCFKSFNVYKRETNYGKSNNIRDLIEKASKKHERIIRTDEGVEFSPDFLQYVNQGLEKYEKDKSVIAVSGYSYPVDWVHSEGANAIKENFVCSECGVGYWTDKRKRAQLKIKSGYLINEFRESFFKKRLKLMTDTTYLRYTEACLSARKVQMQSSMASFSEASLRAYLAVFSKYVIMPTVSKVRIHSLDGGTVDNYDYANQPIDTDVEFELCVDNNCDMDENRKRLNAFECCDAILVKKRRKEVLKRIIVGHDLYRAHVVCSTYIKKNVKRIFKNKAAL